MWNPFKSRVRSPALTRHYQQTPGAHATRLSVERLEDRSLLSTLVALTTNNRLVAFDSTTPGTIASSIIITGLQPGEVIHGIDFRPATGQLFGVGDSDRLYRINLSTGAATQVGTGTFAVSLDGGSFGFDFNPAVDRIRVVSGVEQNMRLHPDTGAVVDGDTVAAGTQPDKTLAYASGDVNFGKDPTVAGSAYSNNFAGTASTTLFGIDAKQDVLVTQGGLDGTPSPNDGQLFTVGSLGLNINGRVGFDISSDGAAYAVLSPQGGNFSSLYRIDLNTGETTLLGRVGSGLRLRGLTALPEEVYALTTDHDLLRFNSATPEQIISSTPITGLVAGETLVGIDFRPATAQLFAVSNLSRVYTINPATGAATAVGTMPFVPAMNPMSAGYGIDFNPTVDRLRIVNSDDENFRVNPNDGMVVDGDANLMGTQYDTELVYTDANALADPLVVASAYTNSFPGATTTTLYGIDANLDSLLRQGGENGTPSPNLGQLTEIGDLGFNTSELVGFDIGPNSGAGFASLTVNGTSGLYRINLTTGAATFIGNIGGLGVNEDVRGLAVAAPTVHFSKPKFSVSEGGRVAVITVVRSGGSRGVVTVNFSTSDGSAKAGADYRARSGSITFNEGEMVKTIRIAVFDDAANEPDENLMVSLPAVSGSAAIGDVASAMLTILDND